ncbi:MAG: hypothetical protein H0X53_03940 [Sphingomonas sp.]|nr:hypothetical protein [Sphingomonas sp.]
MNKFRSAILGGAGVAPSTPLISGKRGGKAKGDHLNSIDIPRDAARSADHRDEDRHRLARETATIGYKGKMIEIDLINLSGGGAMIEADISPRLWDRIDLYLGAGSPIECAVRWLRGGRIGLEFAHETQIECSPEERDALLLDVIRRSFPDLVATVPMVEPEPKSDPVATSRRGAVRHPLIWNGQILWQHDVHTVRLRNISASGVLIDSQLNLSEGVELMLDLGKSGQYLTTISWSRGGQAGLVFKRPFDLSALAAAKPDVAPQRWDRPSYLDRSSGRASPWASELERSELSDLQGDLEGFLKY